MPTNVRSLLDLLKINAPRFVYVGGALERASIALGSLPLGDPIAIPDQDELAAILNGISSDLKALELSHSFVVVDYWNKRFSAHDRMTHQEGRCAVDEIRRSIYQEIGSPMIVFLDQKAHKIGEEIHQGVLALKDANKFPSCWYELDWAAHCYRMEAFTASVFHAMRSIELALCAVAKGLGVPYEFEQWQTIIERIESKIKDLSNLPKGQQKSEDQEFYSTIAKEFRYFKDAWRNHVSHSRKTYDDTQAKDVCMHVVSFIKHAGERLAE
jgi:hypothetical protein